MSSLVLLVAAACADEAELAPWYFAELDAPEEVRTPVDTAIGATLVRRYGTLDGPGALGGVTGITANDTLLAVSDVHGCDIVLFSRATGAALRRIGGCGKGPGEFQRTGALAFHGDSLAVFDDAAKSLTLLDLEGRQLRRVVFPPFGGTFDRPVTRVDPLDDDTVVLHSSVKTLSRYSPQTSTSVTVVSWTRPDSARTLLHTSDAPRSPVNNFSTTHASCVVARTDSGARRLVALNQWVPQLVVRRLSADEVERNLLLHDVPLHPRPEGDDEPALLPNGYTRGACSDSLALFTFRRAGFASEKLPRDAHLILLRPDRGEHRIIRLAEDDTLFRGELLGGRGDSFFFVRNSDYDYPTVVEVALTR